MPVVEHPISYHILQKDVAHLGTPNLVGRGRSPPSTLRGWRVRLLFACILQTCTYNKQLSICCCEEYLLGGGVSCFMFCSEGQVSIGHGTSTSFALWCGGSGQLASANALGMLIGGVL